MPQGRLHQTYWFRLRRLRVNGYEKGRGRTKLYGLYKSLVDIGCSDYEASMIMLKKPHSCTIRASAQAKSRV